ncbi:hypothetical protein CC80DRAFT_535618 [Byssothecium circinans]|uniref:DUF7730 domain-containing protein n=1 Tax=Byssothecium circinans TaxID=147558 RepID=A0A6A5TUG9_9PLEO|nr:hypothetical protein CC80DRAFT_535618 [Byssothecium circinans]
MEPRYSLRRTGARARRQRKITHRLESGLVSLEQTPADLVQVVQNNSKTTLLSLPAEIRMRIWEYALGGVCICHVPLKNSDEANTKVFDEDTAFEKGSGRDFSPRRNDKSSNTVSYSIALLPVCRQIYSEVAVLPYSLNTFYFHKSNLMRRWWKLRQPAQRNAVQHITMDVWEDFSSCCEILLSTNAFPNLKTVTVVCWCQFYYLHLDDVEKYFMGDSYWERKKLQNVEDLEKKGYAIYVQKRMQDEHDAVVSFKGPLTYAALMKRKMKLDARRTHH